MMHGCNWESRHCLPLGCASARLCRTWFGQESIVWCSSYASAAAWYSLSLS